MLIYILLVGEIFLFNYLRKKKLISRKKFCIIIGVSFALITGLRSVNVGSDTTGYYLLFEDLGQLNLQQLLNQERRDLGYYILAWIIKKYTRSFIVLLLITASVFYYSISKLIYKYSDDCALSYLVLMAFNFFQFSMTGMRQTLALGFAILFVLEIIEENPNYLKAILWCVLGIVMHRSCLLVLIYLVIKRWRNNINLLKLSAFLVPICFWYRNAITISLLGVFEKIGFDLDTYEGNGGGLTTYLIYILLLLWGIFLTRRGESEKQLSIFDLFIMVFAVSTQSFVMVNSIFFRVVWYFAIYLIIYLPKMIVSSKVNRQSEKILRFFVYLGVLYMYFGITIGSAYVVPYQFFWQG